MQEMVERGEAMHVLFINAFCGVGSTGRICAEMAQKMEAEGQTPKIAYGRDPYVPEQFQKYAVRIGTNLDRNLHAIRTRILDEHGLGSKHATRQFLKWADEFDPELLWLHNLHGYYINYELLFAWIKSRPQMKVCWTLHDCWTLTGHCTHFMVANCDQWKTACTGPCPEKRRYPGSVLKDNCRNNFLRKKAAFTGVKDMTLIAPSQWLADLVKQSYLKEYPVEVHRNTINTDVFKPTQGTFRTQHGLQNKKIILGVANVWDDRKGFEDFLMLADRLPQDNVIVLVGLTEEQIGQCKPNMLGIKRTNSPQELAEIYTAADVFVNPTHEDNYPTVNLEAEACGTRVITYRTGGAPETIHRADSVVIEAGNIAEILRAL